MRLLAVGDLHGNTDLLFRLLEQEKPDGFLGVGDWGDAGQIAPQTWRELLDRVPVATVFGNHDDIPFLSGLRNRDGSPVLLAQGETRQFCGLQTAGISTDAPPQSPFVAQFRGVCIAAVSGIWAKSHKKDYWVTDADVAGWADQIQSASPNVDILLTHGCPIGIADRTPSGRPGGQRCFLDLLKTVKPRVYLCGHIHQAQRRDLSDPLCSVFNTGDTPRGTYVVIEQSDAGDLSADLRRLDLTGKTL